MVTIVGAGHKPWSLDGIWAPRKWMPAVELLRQRIECIAQAGPVRMMSDMEPGFGLMLAYAALLARDEGLPVTLVAWLAYPGQEQSWASQPAAQWFKRILDRRDVEQRQVLAYLPPAGPGRADAVGARRHAMLGEADQVMVCWNGRPTGETAKTAQQARRVVGNVVNVYDEIAKALAIQHRAG